MRLKHDGGRKLHLPTSSIAQNKREPSDRRKKAEETLTTSIAAPQSLFRAWQFGFHFAHPEDLESDTCLAECLKKNEKELALARTRSRKPWL